MLWTRKNLKGNNAMSNNSMITSEQFSKRLTNLCLRSGLAGMPKDETDQHILLKSAVLLIGNAGPLTEKEVNDRLQVWLTQVCVIKNFDRVTLRRWLVDTGYLTRDGLGINYRIAVPEPRPDLFDPAVDQIDVVATIRAAREEMELKKQAYLAKSKSI
jgi:hypothetical protein